VASEVNEWSQWVRGWPQWVRKWPLGVPAGHRKVEGRLRGVLGGLMGVAGGLRGLQVASRGFKDGLRESQMASGDHRWPQRVKRGGLRGRGWPFKVALRSPFQLFKATFQTFPDPLSGHTDLF
jgi:hypothetical protein